MICILQSRGEDDNDRVYIPNHNEHSANPFISTKSAESILAPMERVKDSQAPRTFRAGN
jgi:hypothetical protein